MYQAELVGRKHSIQKNDDQWHLNGLPFDGDLIALGNNQYHLIRNGKSILLEVLQAEKHQFQIRVNGKVIDISLKDKTTLMLEQMGLGQKAKAKVNDLKAPMPGLIVEVAVSAGQLVKKGEVLLVLEAMKMENAIKADHDVTIDQIKVQKGQKVEKGTVLISFQKD